MFDGPGLEESQQIANNKVTDNKELLMKTNMGAGHGGKSGRWNSVYEVAEEYAFILWQMGMTEAEGAD